LLASGQSDKLGLVKPQIFSGTTIALLPDMESSVEALRLRRMRVQNEISLSKKRQAERAEDLEALQEELLRLSKQIEEIEC
jgi:uncharacterized protein involved in exopolysaccharide biosynthesis